MSLLITVVLVIALVMGIIAVVESGLRNWAGWGVVLIAGALLVTRLT
jgi:hypothetical protein